VRELVEGRAWLGRKERVVVAGERKRWRKKGVRRKD
jgi:hypothetical protein